MRDIGVVGLGLIGGSLCKTIQKRTRYRCWGLDTDENTMEAAIASGAVQGRLEDLSKMDLTIVCLHPYQTIDFILENAGNFRPGSIVIDVCGVKAAIVEAVTKPLQEHGVTFIGTHPMAGREFSGFSYAVDNLFDNASFIITPSPETPQDKLEALTLFALELHFNRIVCSDPMAHDKTIAFTSQLAHVVSNAYVKSPTLQNQSGYSAGSFLDLTRVAKLNEAMWTDLFTLNREPLLFELDTVIERLGEYRQALADQERDRLRGLLRDGRVLKEQSLQKNTAEPSDIQIDHLKADS